MILTENEKHGPLDRTALADAVWVIIHKKKKFISRVCATEAIAEQVLADREESADHYKVEVWGVTETYPDEDDGEWVESSDEEGVWVEVA